METSFRDHVSINIGRACVATWARLKRQHTEGKTSDALVDNAYVSWRSWVGICDQVYKNTNDRRATVPANIVFIVDMNHGSLLNVAQIDALNMFMEAWSKDPSPSFETCMVWEDALKAAGIDTSPI